MKHYAGEWMRQDVDTIHRHTGHLDDAPHGVAFATPLHSEEADRVGLIQVEGNLPAAGLAKHSVLRRTARHAEDGVVAKFVPGRGLQSIRSGWIDLIQRLGPSVNRR